LAEKLIVKNFGPIKHVELDIKKVNVLIGEQGTGKSALVRLLNHFTSKNFFFGHIIESESEFEENFFNNANSEIKYISPDFQIEYKGVKDGFSICFTGKSKHLLERFSIVYKNFIENFNSEYKDEFYSLSKWFDENILTNSYIPAERNTVSILDRLTNSSRLGLDQYIINFFEEYGNARAKLIDISIPYLKNVTFKRENLNDKVIFNGEELLLRTTSSGFQSSIPLAVFIEYFTSIKDKIRFIIEEPELNLFPTTQYELMKYLIEKTCQEKNGLFLATHSPYILTSLNNMMYAYIIGQTNLEKVSKEIDKKYWLNPDEVSAYRMKSDGTAENIKDDEGLIIAEEIDEVSKTINKEFNTIMDIELGVDEESK